MDLINAEWRKSSHSSSNGNCVELAGLPHGIAVRDSKNPDAPALLLTRAALRTAVRTASSS
jgi:hypothetical protein